MLAALIGDLGSTKCTLLIVSYPITISSVRTIVTIRTRFIGDFSFARGHRKKVEQLA
jgi:hypothetical protein